MFQQLRQGVTVYILYKVGKFRVELAEVVSVGVPTPQLTTSYQPNGQFMPPKNVIDIKVNVNGQTIDLQKLPAENCIADFGESGMVVSTSKDAILTEITTLRNNSQRVIDSVEKHKENIECCNKLIEDLNPEIKKEQELNKEIGNLKSEITQLKEVLAQFINNKKTE